MKMPWGGCRWKVTGNRTANMIHYSKSWTHKVTFSEDMQTCKVVVYGKQRWEVAFVQRLTEKEVEQETK